MLFRVLEPEVMDTPDDATDYDAMDFGEPNRRFAADAVALLPKRAAPIALDLGTGTAQIPILMLEQHPSLSVVAVDLATHMLALASARVERAGLGGRCELLCADLKRLDLEDERFDLVMSNSTLHHLAEPVTLLREAARLVKPGGAILVRDLIRPSSESEAWGIVERVAPNDSPRQKQLFFDSLRAALTLPELERAVADAGLHGARVARISDRHFTLEWSADPEAAGA